MAEDNELDIMDEMDDTPEEEVHSLDIIMDFLASPDNVADRLEDGILATMGDKIAERIQKDEETMKEWKKFVEWGVDVNKQTLGAMDSNEGPFQNSANFKSPLMRKSSLSWSDRASIEILRSADVVKSDIIVKAPKPAPQPPSEEELGQMPQEQAQQIKQTVQSQQDQVSAHEAIKDKGERVSTHLNYQINFQMDWRESHDKMLYELPNIGNVFKKTFYDPIEQTNITSLIHFPDFIVNMDATGLDEYAFTEKMEVTKNQALTNMRSGVWIDADLDMDDDNEDFDGTFYEHQGWYDLDDDGYEEPYIVTIHKASTKVVRIVPRYDEEDVFIMNESGSLISLLELIEANAETSEEEPDFEGIDIVKIVGSSMITKYGFIPADDGSYLDWGYYHLLGHLTALINNLTNLAINAGKLANQPSGFIASTFRKAKNVFKMGPGEWKPLDIPPSDLASSFYQMPFKGADPSLMALMTDINQQIAQLSSTLDLSNVLNTNAPASTTLALIQENMVSSSAIISRVYRAMATEFDKLAELNFKHTDPEEYKLIVGDAEADPKIDYSEENINIMHVANPELSSKMERIQLGEVAVAQIPIVQQLGGNPTKIMKDFFKAIGYDGGEEVFQQSEGEANAQQKIEMQQQELTKTSQEQHQQQLDMLQSQQELETRKQDLAEDKFEAESQRDNAVTSQKLDLNEEEIALKGEEQDRKNEETRLKTKKLPLEQNKLLEEGHKLHEEALNEGNTDDRDS